MQPKMISEDKFLFPWEEWPGNTYFRFCYPSRIVVAQIFLSRGRWLWNIYTGTRNDRTIKFGDSNSIIRAQNAIDAKLSFLGYKFIPERMMGIV